MPQQSKIRVYKGVEVEVIIHGQPDPTTAAKAILPLILEMWDKQQETKTQTRQQEAA